MHTAILTFEGFNEIDSFVALNILNRVDLPGWKAEIAGPAETLTSMNGVVVQAGMSLDEVSNADAVLIGSGIRSAEFARSSELMARLRLDPSRQLIGSQCSGALMLASLELLPGGRACTDRFTRPTLESAGIEVLERSFHAQGAIATAGGCLSACSLAAWVIWRGAGRDTAMEALSSVAPVGESGAFVDGVLATVAPFMDHPG